MPTALRRLIGLAALALFGIWLGLAFLNATVAEAERQAEQLVERTLEAPGR